jgi:hypothetical protein
MQEKMSWLILNILPKIAVSERGKYENFGVAGIWAKGRDEASRIVNYSAVCLR